MSQEPSLRQTRFDEVLEQYRGRMGRIALSYAGQDSDDLLQEILLQVWRSLPGFEDRASIGTWCYRIAINTAISWKRKAKRKQVERPSNALDKQPATSEADSNEAGLLNRFLASLSDVDQAVLLMHLDNVNHSEIAAALGVSEGAIRTRMSRLRQKLAAWNNPLDPTPVQKTSGKEAVDG